MRPSAPAQLELRLEPEARRAAPRAVEATDLADHARRIGGVLTVVLPRPVDVRFTDNRSTMISHRERRGRIELRLHRMFRHADALTLEALARFVRSGDRAASLRLDGFIAAHRAEIRGGRARRAAPAGPRGEAVDLAAVLERVSRRYFGGDVDVRIGWGRRARRRSRRGRTRSRALATYSFDDRTVRVSPVLDSSRVPSYVLDWIVYHELLHHVLPAERAGARRRYHTRSFRALERAFERYEEAKRWEEENLEWLLR